MPFVGFKRKHCASYRDSVDADVHAVTSQPLKEAWLFQMSRALRPPAEVLFAISRRGCCPSRLPDQAH